MITYGGRRLLRALLYPISGLNKAEIVSRRLDMLQPNVASRGAEQRSPFAHHEGDSCDSDLINEELRQETLDGAPAIYTGMLCSRRLASIANDPKVTLIAVFKDRPQSLLQSLEFDGSGTLLGSILLRNARCGVFYCDRLGELTPAMLQLFVGGRPTRHDPDPVTHGHGLLVLQVLVERGAESADFPPW